MSIRGGLKKITSSITSSMKKKQILTAFLDKYSNLLDHICEKMDNDINIATIITIVNSLKKRNPKLIIELWHSNVAVAFTEMKITRDNFAENTDVFIQLINGDKYFSESVRTSTENIYAKMNDYINDDNPLTPELFDLFENTVKLSIIYNNL
jgi:hypothetical protein